MSTTQPPGPTLPAVDADEYGPENPDTWTGPPLTLADLADEADSAERTYTTPPADTVPETLIVDGRNIAVRVRSGCLEVEDGIHPHRRTRTVTRSDAGSKRLLAVSCG